MSICKGIAGKSGKNPVGIFIHNDAGGSSLNATYWANALATGNHNLENGFAHAYAGNDGIQQVEDDANCAWHCGNTDGNVNYLSIEVCQSMGDLETFKQNEERALQWCAQKCKQYGITPSTSTIRLHKEVYATACPHRSVEIHGGDSATKAYFIKRIKEIMNANNVNKTINATIPPNTGANYMRKSLENVSGDIYPFNAKANGFYLTAADKKAGANVDFRNFDCGNYQKWRIVKKTYKNADYTMFESVAKEGLYLSVEDNGIGSNNLKLWTDLHNQKQKFYVREEADGRTLIIHAYTGKCVSAKD